MEPLKVDDTGDDLKDKTPDQKSTDTVSIEEFNKVKELLENSQKAQAGVDKKNQEYQETIRKMELQIEEIKQQAKKDKMSDLEKVNSEISELRQQLKEKDEAQALKEFKLAGYKMANEKGLPTVLIDNYGGTKEGLEEYLDNIAKEMKTGIDKGITDKLKTSHQPKSGIQIEGFDFEKATSEEKTAHYEKMFENLHNANNFIPQQR